MKEITAEERTRFFKEMTLRLNDEGYAAGKPQDGLLPVEWHGEPLCRVTSGGGVQFRESELERDGAREAYHRLSDLAAETAQYLRLFDQAPTLKADGLSESYRCIADFNGAVLAAHPTKYGMQFITWEWSYDHTSMWQGHYYKQDFGHAKEDFAIRAGLIERDRLFSPEQQAEVYRSIHETLDNQYPITDERRKLLESAAEQIERVVPGLGELVERSNQLELEEGAAFLRGQELL